MKKIVELGSLVFKLYEKFNKCNDYIDFLIIILYESKYIFF